MPETNFLLANKVIVTESPPTTQTIQGVPTAIAAFVGLAAKGPIGVPQFCTNFSQFVSTFGSYYASGQLAMQAEGFFDNGGTQAWFTRTCHYTDVTNPASYTAATGSQDLPDRGGAATPAKLTSSTGPFDLSVAGLELEIKIDAASAQNVTFTATPASVTTGNATFVLSNGMTLVYKTQLPGSSTYGPLRTITFSTGQFVSIGAATAQEVVNAINSSAQCVGIQAVISASAVKIETSKKGSGAALNLDASSTSLTALTLTAGTTNGTGNVADIDAVQASEIAGLFTALPLTTGTVTAVAGAVVVTGVVTGSSGAVVITTNTTATGIFAGGLPITVHGSNSGITNTLLVTAINPGLWITAYEVIVAEPTNGNSAYFNLSITQTATGVGETWPNVSMSSSDPRYVVSLLNDTTSGSNLVTITNLSDATSPPNNRPADGTYTSWSGQSDGLSSLADVDFIGSSAGGTGIYSFNQIDNVTILCIPDRPTSAVQNAMGAYCDVTRNKSCFAIFDPPLGLTAQQMLSYATTTAGLVGTYDAAAIYWPNIQITNPSQVVFGSGSTITVPISGFMAGVYSRTDGLTPGGVYQAPAGLFNDYGVLFGAVGLETQEVLDEAKRDVIQPSQINPITRINGSAIHADGHDNLMPTSNFPSIPERRGASFIEVSCKKGTLFAKHRNNDRRLRMEVKTTIESFLLRQYENGAFRGDTPNESFYVDVSDQLNPIESIFAGILRVQVGLATEKPVKWLILDFTQDTRALNDRLAQITSSTSTNSNA